MTSQIHDAVREYYARAALSVSQRADCCDPGVAGSADCCGPAMGGSADCCRPAVADDAAAAGALVTSFCSAEEIASLPESAALASLGCGNPLAVAELKAGERVLDLGSGGGIDVLLSAGRVGPEGRAFGLDMTDEMLALARHNAADAGARNVEFLKGHIEDIPLPADSIDVVISNCVINLAADKGRVFHEMARVLRPGGRVGVTDIVSDDALTPEERAESGSYCGCIAGALSFSEYRAGLGDAGFVDVTITPAGPAAPGMVSAIIRARKPVAATA